MMNSNELMNRAWQYDIVGMLGFVLSNTSNTDFGRVFFLIFGVAMILASLFIMLMAFKREVREEKQRERMVKDIMNALISDGKVEKTRQKRARTTKNEKTTNNTTTTQKTR